MPLRCLIVEDQLMIQQLLSMVLANVKGLKVVATASTEAEGVAACEAHHPEMLLLDLALPDGNGVVVARHLINVNPSARIIILSGETSTFVCPDDLGPHIQAVLRKEQAYDELTREIRELLPVTEEIPTCDSLQEVLGRLSPKERKVFTLIGNGMLTKQIAAHLGISIHTVQGHRKEISRKLGTVGNELTLKACEYALTGQAQE
jgi:DNA-binding NarL/FixJ family response regulator